MSQHLLGIQDLSKEELMHLLVNAKSFQEVGERNIKKVPSLRGKTIINMFFEPSTRTRASFEIAGKRMSADTINITGSTSSAKKLETLLDTMRTLEYMNPDVVVVRHSASGAPKFVADNMERTSVVNAGDGMHEHPTQAMLDCLSLMDHYKGRSDGIEKLKVAIVGDIRHSRTARSLVWAGQLLDWDIRLVGPPTLIPPDLVHGDCFGQELGYSYDLAEGLEGVDVVYIIRMQLEREAGNFVPTLEEYTREYFVTEKILADVAPDSVVLTPGPINRGVEVESSLIDGPRSLMTTQVTNGVAVRMAVLFHYALGKEEQQQEKEEVEIREAAN